MENEKRPIKLEDNIHKILYGTVEEKTQLQGQFFHIADTPEFIKKPPINLTGNYFTVSNGVIARHMNKDADHNLSEQNWLDLQKEIKEPFLITKYKDGYNFFTKVQVNGKNTLVGVELKNIGENIEINAVKTAFGKDKIQGNVIYISKNITPAQTGLLGVTNLPPLHPAQGDISSLSTNSQEKSSEISQNSENNSILFDEDNDLKRLIDLAPTLEEGFAGELQFVVNSYDF